MTNNTVPFVPKNPLKFSCDFCHYITSNKKDYNKHLTTLKHKKLSGDEDFSPDLGKIYKCNCGKIYKHSSSLWNHKQTCQYIESKTQTMSNDISSNYVVTPELIIELIKNNTEMQHTIMNLHNTIQNLVTNGITNTNTNNNNNNNNNNINSNNKSFNLQFFLNETCKNAMNIMDFANSIQFKLTDLENIGELGYVDGISKIIIDNLKLLDITQIPVHCSDFKRDVMYVKDNDKWEKENDDKPNIKKLINYVTDKNISLISEWKQKFPECTNSNSNKSTKINKMIMEVMDTDKEKKEKIIKKIAKETL
jgi:hypothetical protein